jgi:hypothetical protein
LAGGGSRALVSKRRGCSSTVRKRMWEQTQGFGQAIASHGTVACQCSSGPRRGRQEHRGGSGSSGRRPP